MQLNRPRSALIAFSPPPQQPSDPHPSFSSQFKAMRFSYHLSPQPGSRKSGKCSAWIAHSLATSRYKSRLIGWTLESVHNVIIACIHLGHVSRTHNAVSVTLCTRRHFKCNVFYFFYPSIMTHSPAGTHALHYRQDNASLHQVHTKGSFMALGMQDVPRALCGTRASAFICAMHFVRILCACPGYKEI